ncbi:myosin-G heavy chain-like [Octopus bimaculoides]|uniref:myosin-G heavy chain-like n=1 Tax=Octopus bimaculoides TaxID=37653 RepID=UPI00071C8FE8|nr:myosin-G heavy chain-like [Octopus bimaculoides]|eukprot:XP_014772411.1 PREDICTED: myosin-G heavy chain-like [Octopus bimaculoides]
MDTKIDTQMLSLPLFCILPLLLTPLVTVSVQSQDALLDVSVNCSQLSTTNASEVTVKADRDIKITLLCKGAVKTYYLLNNNVKLTIPIHRFDNEEEINNNSRSEPVNDSHNSNDDDGNDDNNSNNNKTIDNQPDSNTDTCVFNSVPNEEIYGIQMTVSRVQGQNSDLTMRNYILSCTLNEYGVAKSLEIPVMKDMSAVEALEQFMGKKVSWDVELKLYDIMDQPITSPVPIQKKFLSAVVVSTVYLKLFIQPAHRRETFLLLSLNTVQT